MPRRTSEASRLQVLAGLGAFAVTSALLYAVAFVLWFERILRFPSGPPRFEPLLLPAYLVGAFVAYRVGGRRGIVTLLAFALWTLALPLYAAWPLAAIQGARFGQPIPVDPDWDFVVPQAWGFAGIAIGLVLARQWRIDVQWVPLLSALGLLVAANAIWSPFVIIASDQLCSTSRLVHEGPCYTAFELIEATWLLAAGLVAGVVAAKLRAGLAVLLAALVLALPSAVITFYQGSTAPAGLVLPGIFQVAGGVLSSIALLLGFALATAVRVRSRRREQPAT